MRNSWVEKLFKKSISKQAKFRAILQFLGSPAGKRCLDIGGDNGVISYHLRAKGGRWSSADLGDEAVDMIKEVVGKDVYRIDEGSLPFPDETFDVVVIVDFLEHIADDKAFIVELARVMKKGAALLVNVPNLKRFSLLRIVEKKIGPPHGHLREGYTIQQLRKLLGGRFRVLRHRTYSRSFSELVDVLVRLAGKGRGKVSGKKGVLTTEETTNSLSFRLYSAVYPLVWLISRLDILLFFADGYSLIVKAEKI